MNGFQSFLALPEQDRRDYCEAAAERLNTFPWHVEKDFWVCLVLNALFNGVPEGHPRLLFKGGTSLSKAFKLINRFSEDVDIVVFRDDLGFEGERDPILASHLSTRKRRALFDDLSAECSNYIRKDLREDLALCINDIAEGCQVEPDESDEHGQTLILDYPTLFPHGGTAYVAPRVKIEAGAKSALVPNQCRSVTPYVADEFPDSMLTSRSIRVFAPERTYLDKLIILHSTHCGYREVKRLPKGNHRISRHYYDVAVMTETDIGQSALTDIQLLDSVRIHNLIAYRQAWKRLDEAIPGSLRLVPQPELQAVIEDDYRQMQSMIFGDAPDFGWILNQLRCAETVINKSQATPLRN